MNRRIAAVALALSLSVFARAETNGSDSWESFQEALPRGLRVGAESPLRRSVLAHLPGASLHRSEDGLSGYLEFSVDLDGTPAVFRYYPQILPPPLPPATAQQELLVLVQEGTPAAVRQDGDGLVLSGTPPRRLTLSGSPGALTAALGPETALPAGPPSLTAALRELPTLESPAALPGTTGWRPPGSLNILSEPEGRRGYVLDGGTLYYVSGSGRRTEIGYVSPLPAQGGAPAFSVLAVRAPGGGQVAYTLNGTRIGDWDDLSLQAAGDIRRRPIQGGGTATLIPLSYNHAGAVSRAMDAEGRRYELRGGLYVPLTETAGTQSVSDPGPGASFAGSFDLRDIVATESDGRRLGRPFRGSSDPRDPEYLRIYDWHEGRRRHIGTYWSNRNGVSAFNLSMGAVDARTGVEVWGRVYLPGLAEPIAYGDGWDDLWRGRVVGDGGAERQAYLIPAGRSPDGILLYYLDDRRDRVFTASASPVTRGGAHRVALYTGTVVRPGAEDASAARAIADGTAEPAVQVGPAGGRTPVTYVNFPDGRRYFYAALGDGPPLQSAYSIPLGARFEMRSVDGRQVPVVPIETTGSYHGYYLAIDGGRLRYVHTSWTRVRGSGSDEIRASLSFGPAPGGPGAGPFTTAGAGGAGADGTGVSRGGIRDVPPPPGSSTARPGPPDGAVPGAQARGTPGSADTTPPPPGSSTARPGPPDGVVPGARVNPIPRATARAGPAGGNVPGARARGSASGPPSPPDALPNPIDPNSASADGRTPPVRLPPPPIVPADFISPGDVMAALAGLRRDLRLGDGPLPIVPPPGARGGMEAHWQAVELLHRAEIQLTLGNNPAARYYAMRAGMIDVPGALPNAGGSGNEIRDVPRIPGYLPFPSGGGWDRSVLPPDDPFMPPGILPVLPPGMPGPGMMGPT